MICFLNFEHNSYIIAYVVFLMQQQKIAKLCKIEIRFSLPHLVNRLFNSIMACNYIFWFCFMIFLYSEWSSAVEWAFLVIKRTLLFHVLWVLRPVQENLPDRSSWTRPGKTTAQVKLHPSLLNAVHTATNATLFLQILVMVNFGPP